MTLLVTFGDSWPYGDGIPKPYGAVLSEMLGVNGFVNCSQPATSNEHMLLQLKDFLETSYDKNQETLAIFFLTSIHRCLFYDQGKPVEVYPWIDDSKGPQSQAYFRYLHSDEIEHFRLNQTVLALQKICASFGIKDYYFSGWQMIDLNWPGIDLDKVFGQGKITAAEWIGAKVNGDMIEWQGCDNVLPNDCHPNQRGHELIAENLAKWILCQD